ncbi:MAG: hypothetical protein MPJ50_12500 [Pirellulales bacterium]|nr:hypothetical protein [Pirellulales bacterium]
MVRRMFSLAVLATLLVTSSGLAQQQTGRRRPPPNGLPTQTSLKDILVRELRVRFVKEEVFINNVVQLTEQQRAFTPQFVLAITRNAQRRNIIYPFPYFQAMMVRIAEVKGVNLQPL